MILNWGQLCPQGTLGDVWRQFLVVMTGVEGATGIEWVAAGLDAAQGRAMHRMAPT